MMLHPLDAWGLPYKFSLIFIFLYIFFRRIINAITQMTTENKDPAAVASPIGRSVVEKSVDIR